MELVSSSTVFCFPRLSCLETTRNTTFSPPFLPPSFPLFVPVPCNIFGSSLFYTLTLLFRRGTVRGEAGGWLLVFSLRVRFFFFLSCSFLLAYTSVSFYRPFSYPFFCSFDILLFCLVLSRRGFGARFGEKVEVDEYFRTPRSEKRPLHNPLAAEFGVYDQHHLDEFILDYLPTFSLVRLFGARTLARVPDAL